MIRPLRLPDDMDDEQWLRLIRAFDGAKDFRVAGDATDIFHALRLACEGHKIVLPALQNLHVQEPIPVYGRSLRDSVESFVTQRPLSSHPVQIYYSVDEGALAFFETVTKSIDENPESAEAASNMLDEILRTYPPAPYNDDPAIASSSHSGDLLPTSPDPLGNDVFEFIDIDDTLIPDLVAGSSMIPAQSPRLIRTTLTWATKVLLPRFPM